MDHTFDPRLIDGNYSKRIVDIDDALVKLGTPQTSPSLQFMLYYSGCEKLAQAIVGIADDVSAPDAYCKKYLDLTKIKSASAKLRLSPAVTPIELEQVFADLFRKPPDSVPDPAHKSARFWRNKLNHDFGPSHVQEVAAEAPIFVPIMKKFLARKGDAIAYLKSIWPPSGVP